MKYISRILVTVGLVCSLAACTDEAFVTTGPELPVKGDMTVNLTFALPDVAAQTRSKVSGTENRVHILQMVCFDANGLYLGIRKAEITPDAGPTPDTGIIKGTVPQGTSRIHFIANRSLPIPLNFNVGTPEETIMLSEDMSTIWNDADHQEVCYWGYHTEASAGAMESWLNPSSGTSKVYMIRDRAKIEFSYDSTGATVPVTKIEWLIHNGRERGYLAPAVASWTNEGYYTESTKIPGQFISTAGMNEYTAGSRYSLWRSESDNDDNIFDVAYENGANTNIAQFLFDDDNAAIDNVKIILKVTYNNSGKDNTVYHVLKLNDDNKVLYDVVRNNTYYIKAKLLSPDVAFYNTLKEAIDGDEFLNADIEVDRNITDINDDQYTLQILLPTQTTSVVFNTEGNHDMDFAFRTIADLSESGSTDPADFEIKWEKPQTFCTDPTLSYIDATKQFMIHTTVIEGKLTDKLQSEWIVVRHKGSGLTRYIHVYVIDQFRFLKEPTLKAVGDDYVLSFQIPVAENTKFLEDGTPDPEEPIYPTGLYPIDVKFTTNTLNAYGTKQGTTSYGLFGVAVEGTERLTKGSEFEKPNMQPSTTATSDMTHWWFQQENNWWDFWYTYSIKNYAEYTEDGVVNIYFNDVRNHIKYATVGDVGLFMYINYFGKIYSLPVTTE